MHEKKNERERGRIIINIERELNGVGWKIM